MMLLLAANVSFASPQMTIYINASPGSGVDNGVRFVSPIIEKEISGQVLIINTPGADGLVGMDKYNQTKNDCTSILASHSSIPFLAKTKPDLVFDPMQQYTPLYGLTNNHILIVVSSEQLANKLLFGFNKVIE